LKHSKLVCLAFDKKFDSAVLFMLLFMLYSIHYSVIDHAKKTGDFAALSKTDLKLIALAYMLEIEIYGTIEVLYTSV
jgi:hypothetical protein